jgi:SiaC family regulatory phosphoprotein
MNILEIFPTDDSPEINFNPDSGVFVMKGKSLPEDVSSFYEPIISWLEKYAKNPANKTQVNIKLTYFNTASSKLLLDILMKFEEMHEDGKDVVINWFYPGYDEDMKDAGLEYSEMVDIPFVHSELKENE